jgi:tetratricopeptide (TPR) repeat protein
VLWVHASDAARLEQSYRHIADGVKIAGRHDPQANIFKLVHDWLKKCKQRWLLVLDNLDDANFLLGAQANERGQSVNVKSAARPLREYLPRCERGSILITTRNREAALRLVEHRNILSVEPMDEAQALTLLKNKLGAQGDDNSGIVELAAALEYMPLAIVQAAAYISRRAPRYSTAKYLEEFRKSERKRLSLLTNDNGQLRRDSQAKDSIVATWQISFEYIRQTRPSAAELLALMSFFDRQGIPEDVLRWRDKQESIEGDQPGPETEGANSDREEDEEDASQSSTSVESEEDTFQDDVVTLRNFCFIAAETSGTSFEMPALVQLATRTWLMANGQLEQWKQRFIYNLSTAFPPGPYENWAECAPLFAHAKAAARQRPEGELALTQWATLLYRAAWYAVQRGNAAEAEQLAVASTNARRKVLGQEHEDTWWGMSMVADAYSLRGEWGKAEKLQQQVMEKRKTKLGAHHPHTLASMANLASTYRNQGRWEEAEELEVEVMETRKTKLGADHPSTLTSMANLAATYRNQGRWDDAEKLFVQVVETCQMTLGTDHPDTLSSMASLALIYWNEGRWDDAEELFKQVVETSKTKLGADHPSTLSSVSNLASTYRNQGRWDEAENLEVQVLEMRKLKLGSDHPSTLSSMANLASTYSNQGRWDDAEKLFVQVIEIRKTKLGADHPSTLTSMANLAATYRNQGRWDDAEKLFVQVVETCQMTLGTDHPDTLSSMANLASTYRNQGRWKEAEELFVQVIKIRKTKLGADHPSTLTSMANLASIYSKQGRWEDAEKLQVEVLKTRKTKLGDDHPDTLSSMANLASTYCNQGQWENAKKLQVEVVETHKTKLGTHHPLTLTSMNDLASTYTNQGRWEEAEQLELQVLETRKTKLGANHPDTLASMASLMSTYREQGQQGKADILRLQLIDCRKSLDNGDTTEDSNSTSDISDIPSLFSGSSSLDSRSSAGLFGDVHWTATQHLANTLSQDPFLRPLYTRALQEIGPKRFSKQHDRLLRIFLAELRLERSDHIHLQAVRFLRNRSRRKEVTAQICRLNRPHSSLADQQKMQKILDQEEDRSYRLDHYLEARNEPLPEIKAGHEDIDDTDDDGYNEEDENEEEEESDDEIVKVQVEKLPNIESIVAILTKGPSFRSFKTSLQALVDPRTTIKEALSSQDINMLQQLLKERFEVVAKGEYSWIRELDEIGCTRDEIAELLFEQANDAPWIYFEPSICDPPAVQIGVHLPGCVHQFPLSNRSSLHRSAITQASPDGWQRIIRSVEELCGVAGVTPTTRDRESWDGFIIFKEENSVATVTCSQSLESDRSKHCAIISRLINSLGRFCQAAGYAQAAGLCCDSFTILWLPLQYTGQQSPLDPSVEVCRIDFELPLQLLSELKDLSAVRNTSSADVSRAQKVALQILRPFAQLITEVFFDDSVNAGLQICSLATQVVCLGFLSYTQAHAGTIRPFFLDTPLKEIRLLGNSISTDGQAWIEASLKNLTCFGDMIQSQVLTFTLIQSHISSLPITEGTIYNLCTNAYDLLDTWGPGEFLIRGADMMPFAIQIGNGVVYASDSVGNNKFHWSKNVFTESLPQIGLDPLSKMIIGTSVVVNGNCGIDANHCWATSSQFLEPLGPYGTHWELDEKQFGMQAGNYVMVQAIAASHKLPGLTLKQHRLQQDDEMLIPFLDNIWAVQVSFCTRVARRVPLREMIADLLPVFAMASSSHAGAYLWEELLKVDIINAFRHNNIRTLLVQLSSQLHQHVLRMIRRIFQILQQTGLDREGKVLVVAWPHEHELFRCFRIACERENSWAGVLADSEDSATFAYITTRCFETTKIKCSGPSPTWRSTIRLLETAVILHGRDASSPTTALKHDVTYFFQKPDRLLYVKAQRPDTADVASLITSSMKSPLDIQRRLLVRLMKERKGRARLRERIASDDLAEEVVIFQ